MSDEPESQETANAVGFKHPPKDKQFKKGYDPRRNLRGVPRDTIKGRALIRKIGAELLHIKEKGENGEIVEYDITRAEAMIRLMFSSKAPADKQTLLKALWPGLVKDEVDVTSGGEKLTGIIQIIEHDDAKSTPIPPADKI